MRLNLDCKNKGGSKNRNPSIPRHSTRELASEIGIPTIKLSGFLKRKGAPKPLTRWDEESVNNSPNYHNNYYNRPEVLAFLRQIGVLK